MASKIGPRLVAAVVALTSYVGDSGVDGMLKDLRFDFQWEIVPHSYCGWRPVAKAKGKTLQRV